MTNHTKEEKLKAFGECLDILDILREQCPWDKKQTFQSLHTNTIEECFELCDAVLKEDFPSIREELGDLFLHIIFYAKFGEEQGVFDIKDVCDSLREKLIFRHPHVFSDQKADSAEVVIQNWEQLKLKEKGKKRVLQGVPSSLPALIKAHRIQDKARNVGFDWTEREQVWDKVHEEFTELSQEIDRMDQDKIEAEFGDLFFSLINAARLYGIQPDTALERTNQKFIRRFNYLEEKTLLQGRILKEMTLEQMDEIWNEAKKKGL